MSNKIIFLDFDGVITTQKSHWTLDVEKMKLVKLICESTGAKLVISSSWRRFTLEDTIYAITTEEEALGKQPFLCPEDVIGITARMYAFKHGNRDRHYGICRGVEIAQWLDEHKEVDAYVILDDDTDMLLCQKPYFIRTHALYGLSERDAGRAIKILNTYKTKNG